MRQLNKVSTLEVVALCRFVSEAEKRHTMREFAISKLDIHTATDGGGSSRSDTLA